MVVFLLKEFNPGSPEETNRRGSFDEVLKLDPKPFFPTTNRFSSSTLLGWKTWNSVFLSPPSLPSPFLSHPPSFCVCVLLFDGLVSALCFPLSLHSAVQRRHGPEAGHQERERHPRGVWTQGEMDYRSQRHFGILTLDLHISIFNIISCMLHIYLICHYSSFLIKNILDFLFHRSRTCTAVKSLVFITTLLLFIINITDIPSKEMLAILSALFAESA